MRFLFSFILLGLVTLTYGQLPLKPEAIGKHFPKFFASNNEGQINNDSLLGKVVLINFWFEGCHPCLAEFDALNELAEKLKPDKEFEFISFTWDNAETIKRVKEKYGLRFKVFFADANECRRLNQNTGFPVSIILDRQGIIKYLVCGGSTDTKIAREFVMSTLLQEIQKEL
jgi:thiol-disulfide isomerase/thioredoxin